MKDRVLDRKLYGPDTVCPVCMETVVDGHWLLLNRYCIGTGKYRSMVEGLGDKGQYEWCVNESEDLDDFVSGYVLHWPICANQFIEAAMLECDYEGEQQDRETP